MDKKDEALKMAIDVMQNNQTYDWKGNPLTALEEANEKVINSLKEALKQPPQESNWTCNDVDVTNCDVNTLEQFCRDNIRLSPFFAMLAGALKKAKEPDRTGMVYYKNNACKAKDAKSPDCICWTPKQPPQEPLTRAQQVIRANNSVQSAQVDKCPYGMWRCDMHHRCEHPPAWQRLTDDEILNMKVKGELGSWFDIARAIEQALKEKNG